MTREEIRKKILKDFGVKIKPEDDYPEWTEEELLATAKIVAKKLGLTEPFCTENDIYGKEM